MDEKFLQAVAYAGISALVSLEQVKIIHGDIKPENILVTGNWIFKISDFSNSFFQGQLLTNCPGTADYSSPELLSINPQKPRIVNN